MSMNTDSALDNLTRMVQVIGHDRNLRRWFSALAGKSVVERRNEVYAMSEQMRAERKDADLVESFQLLADFRVFEAVHLALRD